jgi:hypothetical protein
MKTVYVVIISEMASTHTNEVDTEVFIEHDAAVSWIEKEIGEKVQTYHLEESAVDGWYVEIDGPMHTIQYDIRECTLH